MDLFGKKALRKKVEEELQSSRQAMYELLRDELSAKAEIRQLREELADLKVQLAVAQEQARFLKAQRDQLAAAPTFSSTPLHFTEEQEDAQFLGRIGLMPEKEVQELLDATGFENSEIEFS